MTLREQRNVRVCLKMEFGQVAEDQNAGYLNENESDLEFSECEDSTG